MAASTLVDEAEFRKFFVFQQGSQALAKVSELMQAEARLRLATMQASVAAERVPAAEAAPFLKRLETITQQGLLGPGAAPYFIIVAEQKGFPQVEQISLAHCLQNMWLKATELGLAFRLFTMTADLLANPAFCALLQLSPDLYGVNGCAVGLAGSERPERAARAFDAARLITEMA